MRIEMLTVPQLVTECFALYGTRKFVIVFTRTRHLSVSWVRRILFTPCYRIS